MKELSKAQATALSYYSRKEIQKAIFEFCKNREVVPNFNREFFGKRPDKLDYPTDLFNLAKQGATSFHCSEELWDDPLKISTDFSPKEYNEIRIGWDFLIDIDSKYLDYSKIAARLLIKELEQHGVKNVGIKFSGSKGFHLLIPFAAFPSEVNGEKTKNNFPEWARLIAGYLSQRIREPMNQEILNLTGREKLEKTGELKTENLCPKCQQPTIKKKTWKYSCPDIRCKSEVESFTKKRTAMLCPSCNAKMNLTEEKEVNYCETCKISTLKEGITSSYGGSKREIKTDQFKSEDQIKSTEDSVDLILVSSRHLFRAPYSLHEKTCLASIVLEKEQIENFTLSDADPLKITQPTSFLPNSEENEADYLLSQALEWGRENAPKEKPKKYSNEPLDLNGLKITEKMFPDCIKKILKGAKQDGRKRQLTILLSFLSTLQFPKDYIEQKVQEWNKKNYHPLKYGYIKSQIDWSVKNPRMPPNYDKPIYKELNILGDTKNLKNPINYTIKEAFKQKGKSDNAK